MIIIDIFFITKMIKKIIATLSIIWFFYMYVKSVYIIMTMFEVYLLSL